MSTFSVNSKSDWIEGFARIGYASKGIVYCLLGILAVIAAFGSGSTDDTNKTNILNIILGQPFGKIILGIVAVGLIGYVMWRAIETIKDPHNHGNSGKGLLTRAGYAVSAIVYAAISYSAFKLIINGSEGGDNGDIRQTAVAKLLEQPFGQWLVGLVALGIFIRGAQQIIKAVSGKYRKGIKESKINNQYKELLIKTGEVGYIARGIVWGLIAFLFMRAAIFSDANEAGSTDDALGLVQTDFGPWVLTAIALGLFCYGVFFMVKAKFSRVEV